MAVRSQVINRNTAIKNSRIAIKSSHPVVQQVLTLYLEGDKCRLKRVAPPNDDTRRGTGEQ